MMMTRTTQMDAHPHTKWERAHETRNDVNLFSKTTVNRIRK